MGTGVVLYMSYTGEHGDYSYCIPYRAVGLTGLVISTWIYLLHRYDNRVHSTDGSNPAADVSEFSDKAMAIAFQEEIILR